MKIALCGTFDSGWANMLLEEGHVVISIFPSSSEYLDRPLWQLADKMKCPIFVHRFSSEDIAIAVDRGAELLISVGYPYVLPVADTLKAINVHPSFLPDGRGIAPIQKIISEHRESAGVTIHKISDEMDAGEIILQERILVSKFDNYETILTRFYLRSARMTSELLKDFDRHWDAAKPQKDIGHWAALKFEYGTLNPNADVEFNLNVFKAFGPSTYVDIEKNRTWVSSLSGWLEEHNYKPGFVLSQQSTLTVLAVLDGFLIIKRQP